MNHEFGLHVPANKFLPPRLNSDQVIFREHLVKEVFSRKGLGRKVISVQAQAGQGKTSTTQQFLTHNNLKFAWYQVSEEDQNPVFFFNALYLCLSKVIKGFQSEALETMIENGQISPIDLDRCLQLLLHELHAQLDDSFYLVFDDLHLVNNESQCIVLLNNLIYSSIPSLRFILLSRREITLSSRTTTYGTDCLIINNEALAFTQQETENLVTLSLGENTSSQVINLIHQRTEGWAMGLALACLFFDSKISQSGPIALEEKDFLSVSTYTEYFMYEVFLSFEDSVKSDLCSLALMNEINVELAERITGDERIIDKLIHLTRLNCFIRSLDDNQRFFSFHHLFQEFLNNKAFELLGNDRIQDTYTTAGNYYLENDNLLPALRCFLLAKDDTYAASILEKRGVELLDNNSSFLIRDALHIAMQENRLKKCGWLSVYYGFSIYDEKPKKSAEFFKVAIEQFRKEKKIIGELLSLSYLIYYNCSIQGVFKDSLELIDRADILFDAVVEKLDPYIGSLICVNLSMAHTFITFKRNRITLYNSYAKQKSRSCKLKTINARVILAIGYAFFFQGRPFYETSEVLLQAHTLAHSNRVSTHDKIIMVGLQANFLQRYGYFESFNEHRHRIFTFIGRKALSKTIIGVWLHIWNMLTLIAQGRYKESLTMIDQELSLDTMQLSTHMLSNLLQYKAYALSHLEQHDEALKYVTQAKELRDIAGGPHFVIINCLVVGAVYTRKGNYTKSQQYLEKAIKIAKEVGQEHLLVSGYFHLAWLHLCKKNIANVQRNLTLSLQLMKQNKFTHFETWTPELAAPLLCEAVKLGIEVKLAKQLSRDKLDLIIQDDGSQIPLLKVRVLGRLSFSIQIENQERVLSGDEVTSAQRTLLALLLTSPKRRLSREYLQLLFWPDITPEKAMMRFDQLMSRLRKVLQSLLHPFPVNLYFGLKHGVIYLDNCWIDALEFKERANEGIRFSRDAKWWQAGNRFNTCFNLWNGCIDVQITGEEQVLEYCDEFLSLYTKISLAWGEYLESTDNVHGTEKTFLRARKYDPLNSDLVTRIYTFYLCHKKNIQARKIIRDYKLLLQNNEFTEEEIQQFTHEIINKHYV